MQYPITLLKHSKNAVEFQGVMLSTQKFLRGMAHSGFDVYATDRILSRIVVGGSWQLFLSRAQVRMISKEAWKKVA